jgi:ketosteroid isomerase-like protein
MSNATTVQEIYTAFGAGDVPTIMGHIADDVQWESWDDNSCQKAGAPWMQPRAGKDGVLEFLGTASELDFQRFEIVAVLEGPNKVVAEMEVAYVGPNGVRVEDQELHYWVFDDAGKVVGFRHYLDTAKHAAALEGAAV